MLAYTYVIFHFQDQLFHANRLITDNSHDMSNLSSTLFRNEITTFENVVYRNFWGLLRADFANIIFLYLMFSYSMLNVFMHFTYIRYMLCLYY